MRKLLLAILCLCSFQSAAVATEQPLLLGALRGPAHATAIALAMGLSETLKRPVIIKAFEDEATMYVWLDHYRMVDFALTSRADLAPSQLHRLGPVPVVDGATSIDLVGHSGLSREVLLQMRDWLAYESRDGAAALSSGKNGAEALQPESAAVTSETVVEAASPVLKDNVETASATLQSLPDADGIKSFLSHLDPGQDTSERAPVEKEPAEPGPDAALEAALPISGDVVEADSAAIEAQNGWDGIEAMMNHWGLSAQEPSESELAPTEGAHPQLFEALSVTSPDSVEVAEETSGQQSSWGGVANLFNQWGVDTEKASTSVTEQVDSVVEPSGPLVVHLVPMMRVMLPERVEDRLLEEFSRLLQQQGRPEQVRFVELDKPLSQIESSWLEQHHSLAGEIFGYQEKTGRLSTTLRLRGRLYYRSPAQAESLWQKEVPIKVSFDPDESSLEEAQDRLVVELAAALVDAFWAEISPE